MKCGDSGVEVHKYDDANTEHRSKDYEKNRLESEAKHIDMYSMIADVRETVLSPKQQHNMKENEFQPIHDIDNDYTNKNYGDTEDLETAMHETKEISGMFVVYASDANISNMNRFLLVFTIFILSVTLT